MRELTLNGMLYVCQHMRQRDWDEISAFTFYESPEDWGLGIWLARNGLRYEVPDPNGTIVCVGGFMWASPAAMQAWMAATDDFDRYGKWVWRAAVMQMMAQAFALGARTLRAQVIETNYLGARFAERAGFVYEGTSLHLGRNGESVMNYSITRQAYEQSRRSLTATV